MPHLPHPPPKQLNLMTEEQIYQIITLATRIIEAAGSWTDIKLKTYAKAIETTTETIAGRKPTCEEFEAFAGAILLMLYEQHLRHPLPCVPTKEDA